MDGEDVIKIIEAEEHEAIGDKIWLAYENQDDANKAILIGYTKTTNRPNENGIVE